MSTAKNDCRLSFRLPEELKQTIEAAAAQLGQTVSDFAVSTLVQTARQVLREQQVTQMSERDRVVFAALLDDPSAAPNAALLNAADRYKQRQQ